MKILLVDDDAFTLQVLAHQLKQLGCTDVVTCLRAREALALLGDDVAPVQLVFCDLQMPDIDGVEFVRHLSQRQFRGSLVLLSGEDERIVRAAEQLANAHRIDVIGAVVKPVSVDQLRLMLSRCEPDRLDSVIAPSSGFSAAEFEQALTRGELVLHFQPKVDLATAALTGVEALVRWQHPDAGLVYPDQFIDMVEDAGLMDGLTRAVLAGTLDQARLWKADGLDLQVAVNISVTNLAQLDFPDWVAQLAHDAGIAPARVMLEVTESRLMQDLRAPLDILTRLRLKRIGLSIDDFGTGHSSLTQLRDIPFDELKLDRSFVHGAGTDSRLGAIVQGTLSMAQQLRIKSVAEGVEDRADWAYLRGLGCDVAQGYFIARPMPAADLVAWHRDWDRRRPTLTAGA